MKPVLLSILIGIAVMVLGLVFMDLFELIFNGLGDQGRVVGGILYTCFVAVVCTGVSVSQSKKK